MLIIFVKSHHDVETHSNRFFLIQVQRDTVCGAHSKLSRVPRSYVVFVSAPDLDLNEEHDRSIYPAGGGIEQFQKLEQIEQVRRATIAK